MRNLVVGVQGLPPALREAAPGLGIAPWQTLWRVELPQALPVIVGGVRLATVATISMATLAGRI